jgi:hypothetical protein
VHEEGLLEGTVGGEVILMNPRMGTYCGLDDIGSKIWTALESPRTLAQIKQFCCSAYLGAHQDISSDTERFVEKLLKQKLIRVSK